MKQNYPLYKHQQVYTLKELINYAAEKFSDNPAFVFPKSKTEDRTVSYSEFQSDVNALGTYFFSEGYRDCKIAVLGENSYDWILTYFAVACGGNVIVPMDKDLSTEDCEYLLRDSDCSILFCSDLYADIAEQLIDKLGITVVNMKQITEMITKGACLLKQGYRDYISKTINPDDLASIVYTSGTTGKPKGVMLSHKNFSASAYGAASNIRVTGASVLMLPLHHCFGLTANVFAEFFYGQPIYISKSLKRIASDFAKVKPQHLFVVPLIVETFYKMIINTARNNNDAEHHNNSDFVSKSFFGGNLELIVSGGAPLNEKYVQAFQSFGIKLLNGYGITECAPIVAVNRNDFSVPESVGSPLCCNTVRISDSGEILVKGDNVMSGYYHNDAETEYAFVDGWFRTGDVGYLDELGALHITGRVKNLIILGNGENIQAESIEQELLAVSYIKEAVVYGVDNIIVAELFLDETVSDARERIDSDIRELNRRLPQNSNIGKIIIRDTEFPKTTTKKIIRNNGGNINA